MEKIEQVNDIINRFTTDDIVLIDKKDLMYLFDSKSIKEIKYTSNVNTDIKYRMNFIINTFNCRVDINEYTRFIMLLKSSSSYPLLVFEVAKLNKLYSKLPEDCRVAWGVGTDESLNKDISIDIIASK